MMIFKQTLKSKELGRNNRLFNKGGGGSSSPSSSSGGGSFLDSYFTYDDVNDVLISNKSIASQGNLVAYASGSTIGSIFDNLPMATTTSKGILQVNGTNGLSITDGVLFLDSGAINPSLSFTNNVLSVNSSTIDLSDLQTDLSGYVTTSSLTTTLGDYVTNTNLTTTLGGYSTTSHNHSGIYEPVFSKNSGFNKSFAGSGLASTISRSDHNHSTTYHPKFGNTSTSFSASQLTLKSGVFTYDSVKDEIVLNKNLRIQGDLLAELNVVAFASGSTSGSIWDDAPIASTTSLGMMQVGNGLNVTDGIVSVNSNAINPTLSFSNNVLSVNSSNVDLSSLSPDLSSYATESWVTTNYSSTSHNHSGVYALIGGQSNKDFSVRNLNVYGELSQINSGTIIVDDALLKLNNGNSLVDSGLIIDNGVDEKARLFFKASTQRWVFGDNDVYNNIASEDWVSGGYLGKTAKAVDSDKLDGLHGASFLRSDLADSTNSGIRTWFGGCVPGQDNSSARLQINGFVRTGNIYLHSGGNTPDGTRNADTLSNDNGVLKWRDNKVWTALTDGSGSGLDADCLDGLHASSFMRSVSDGNYYGLITPSGLDNQWIRTTVNGIIPFQSGGASQLGTSSWNFSEIYGTTIFENNVSLADKYTQNNVAETITGTWTFNESVTSNNAVLAYSGKAYMNGNTSGGYIQLKDASNVIKLTLRGYSHNNFNLPVKIGDNEAPTEALDVVGNIKASGWFRGTTYTGDNGGNYVGRTGTVVQVAKSSVNTGGVELYHNNVNVLKTVSNGVQIRDSNTQLLKGTANSLKVQTNSGYLEIAPQNTSWCHFKSDRNFWFSREVQVSGGGVGSYAADLFLRRDGVTKITIGSSVTTSHQKFQVDGQVESNNIIKSTRTGADAVHGYGGFQVSSGNGRGLRFWTNDAYKIYMSNVTDSTWGGRRIATPNGVNNDYNMYFRMSSEHRGFVFGYTNDRAQTHIVGGHIDTRRNITAGGTVKAYSTSDKRLKTNLKPLSNSLNVINKIDTYSFDYNGTGKELIGLNDDELYDTGVIAQEMEQIPELKHVVGSIYDDYKGVKYEKLIPYLIGAIQELSSEIIELKKNLK